MTDQSAHVPKATKVFSQKQAIGIWIASSIWGAAIGLLFTQQYALTTFFAEHQIDVARVAARTQAEIADSYKGISDHANESIDSMKRLAAEMQKFVKVVNGDLND